MTVGRELVVAVLLATGVSGQPEGVASIGWVLWRSLQELLRVVCQAGRMGTEPGSVVLRMGRGAAVHREGRQGYL